ncbi:uncharacterized protein BYT42DRAFT_611271 [Radiomyces spectabilis]|uniref:uncharacterized protein n=1 Tax=Radiomyces spectabilis TaxID=64574 RepID=UPI00221F0DB3|nr:uncharacterized protein BYT42DRAFT_611271 [Radiomyces spectabilis]KAI8388202.1 hypothetical protein BYT42DRAFT_611271 [Radiomyces spectabilis]
MEQQPLSPPLLAAHACFADISISQWNSLWPWPMNSTARNVWFRVIHLKLPTASRLFELQLAPGTTKPLLHQQLASSLSDPPDC